MPNKTKYKKKEREWSCTRAFEHEGNAVTAVIGLDSDDVFVAGAFEHLGHVVEVHAHGEVAVAAVVLEALRSEEEGHQGHVARIHGLEREPRRRAVEVGVVDQVLGRFQNLLQEAALDQP